MVNHKEGEKFAGNMIGLAGLSKSVICLAAALLDKAPPTILAPENAKKDRRESFFSIITCPLT